MKIRNKFISFFIIIILFLINLQTQSFSNSIANQNIRIGLYFNSTALSSANMNANNMIILNDDNIVLGTIIEENEYIISPVNKKIVLLDMKFSDLNTAIIEAQSYNSIFNNSYFVYLSNEGYSIATFDDDLNNSISLPIENKQIGLFSSSSNPILVYDNSLNIKFSTSIPDEYIKIKNKPYRGNLSFKVDSSNKLTVINTLPIEEYLYGVVAKEMPASWNKEALKAQAISARNYSVKNIDKYKKIGFDLCTTQNSQVYGGVDAENINTNMAVNETKGILAYYNTEVANLFYHSSSGGRTENSENIWSSFVPYLRSVEDSYSLGSPNDYWEYKISAAELENLLMNKGKNIGKLIGIRIDSISNNGRVLKLSLIGDKSEMTLEKESIRSFFGYSNIKSTWFEIVIYQDILFRGRGYGHGLGLSQYGAKTMAEQGFKYDEILKYYFKGIDVY